ncbi:MAG: hypothetical protein NTZ21_16585 [Actinobacteria bacterium]|nr:hypothetical protein [Actinomycetota bacterium]
MDIPTIARATSVFAHQQGLATVGQLRAVGVTEGFIRQRLRTREWRRIHRQVLGLTGAAPSWAPDVRAALLAAGPYAVASHATAGRLHGFDGYDRDERIEISSTDGHGLRSTPGTVVHRSVVLTDRHSVVVGGFRSVIQPVALLQLAAADGADAAGKAFDGMLRAGRSPEWVRTVATEWRSHRMPGASIVFQLLRERIDAPLPGSWFQRLARTAFALRGIELLDEHQVFDGTRHPIARLDLAIPDLLIGVECQSWRWHATPTARADDARRRRRLRALGWEIVEVWWTDLDRLDEVLEELVALIDQRATTRHSR